MDWEENREAQPQALKREAGRELGGTTEVVPFPKKSPCKPSFDWRDPIGDLVPHRHFPLAADVNHGPGCGYEIGLADVVARFFFLDYSANEFSEIFI
jgi:hypothetical protein